MNLGELSKPFPYWPDMPTDREKIRMEAMRELNMWDNNDKKLAQRHAEMLIELLKDQFLNEKTEATE